MLTASGVMHSALMMAAMQAFGAQIIPETLSPVWNETFVFSAGEVKELPSGLPMIEFEVWDSDTINDDFLGQVSRIQS